MNSVKPIRTIHSLAAAAAAIVTAGMLALIGTPAHADTVSDSRSITVSFADLDLGSDQGNQELYRRVKQAARSVCGQPDGRDLRAQSEWHDCQDLAVERAVQDIGSVRLAAIHRQSRAS